MVFAFLTTDPVNSLLFLCFVAMVVKWYSREAPSRVDSSPWNNKKKKKKPLQLPRIHPYRGIFVAFCRTQSSSVSIRQSSLCGDTVGTCVGGYKPAASLDSPWIFINRLFSGDVTKCGAASFERKLDGIRAWHIKGTSALAVSLLHTDIHRPRPGNPIRFCMKWVWKLFV